MNVTATTGYVVFENFMKHLTISHPDYLFQADRTIAMSQPLMITFSSEIGRIALAKTLEQFPKIISIKLVFYRNNLGLSNNSSVNFSFQCIGQSCFLTKAMKLLPNTTSIKFRFQVIEENCCISMFKAFENLTNITYIDPIIR